MKRGQLDEASPTLPLNPRRNFGTDEDKTRFGEELRHAQPAAYVAATRAAYLALWPDHEERIGAAPHVLVNGERRFHGAVHVGLEALDFVDHDDLASSREAFINHLLKENLAREDFDVIERARGVEQLVAVCAETTERGARTRAAEQLGKDRSWVTNQLVLLELPAELQTMLNAGMLPERDGRTLARYAKENPGLGAAALLAICKRRRKLRPWPKPRNAGSCRRCALLKAPFCCPRTTNRPTGLYEERPSLRLSVSRSRKALNPQRTPLKSCRTNRIATDSHVNRPTTTRSTSSTTFI
ncbi:ParB/RepB/Spo0J family partition protein [Streptomyces canus]|uniref:ParB/RepB/Spo0J family partition protein n=1 Tax=Streptomyces canus TaxID=58343 RepID=UPI00324D4A3E